MHRIADMNRLLVLTAMAGLIIFCVAASGCSSEEVTAPDQGVKDLATDTVQVAPDAPQVHPDQEIVDPDSATPDLSAADIDKTKPIHVTNAEHNCDAVNLMPADGEEGHLCAGRLTPPGYPFTVLKVGYRLGHGPNVDSEVVCNGSLEHQVHLYVSSDVIPPTSPASPVIITAPYMDPASIPEGDGRIVTLDVDPPVTLNQGEHLFVAIKYAGTYPDVLCVSTNKDDPYDGDRNYWSNAAAPPYSWTQLDSFGLQGSLLVRAIGTLD